MAVSIVTTTRARVAFLNLFSPRADDAEIDAGKYTCMVLIPKSDTDTIAQIKAGVQESLEKKFGKKLPSLWGNPLKDGDAYFNSLEPEKREGKEYYKGHFYLNLKSNDKPKIQERDGNIMLDRDGIKSGDYARVQFNLNGYDTAGNKGVGAYVGTVQKARDGEAIGGGSVTFGAIEDEEGEDAFAD